jgi:hypothetical protein
VGRRTEMQYIKFEFDFQILLMFSGQMQLLEIFLLTLSREAYRSKELQAELTKPTLLCPRFILVALHCFGGLFSIPEEPIT